MSFSYLSHGFCGHFAPCSCHSVNNPGKYHRITGLGDLKCAFNVVCVFPRAIYLWKNTACVRAKLLALEVTMILTVVSVAVEVPTTPLSLQKGSSGSLLIIGEISCCAK